MWQIKAHHFTSSHWRDWGHFLFFFKMGIFNNLGTLTALIRFFVLALIKVERKKQKRGEYYLTNSATWKRMVWPRGLHVQLSGYQDSPWGLMFLKNILPHLEPTSIDLLQSVWFWLQMWFSKRYFKAFLLSFSDGLFCAFGFTKKLYLAQLHWSCSLRASRQQECHEENLRRQRFTHYTVYGFAIV